MKQLAKPLSLTFVLVVLATTLAVLNTGAVDAQTSQKKAGAAAAVPNAPVAGKGFNVSCNTPNVDPVHGQASCNLLTIPAGRAVVIQTVSCQAELAAGQGPLDVQLIVPNTPFQPGYPDHVSHFLTLTKQTGSSTVDLWRMTSPLVAYGSAPAQGSVGIGLFFRAGYSSSVTQSVFCTMSGYLE